MYSRTTRPSPVEALEPRQLFTGISVIGAGLNVIGLASKPNTIVVGLAPGGTEIAASISYPMGKTTKVISQTVSMSGLTSLVIDGGGRADSITIDQTNGSFPLPTTINAKGGNDTIRCGDEPDVVLAGAGNDYVDGGAGDDILFGQGGKDTLVGGLGNDRLHAGTGHDSLVGGQGNDTLYAMNGGDTLFGGDGTSDGLGGVNTFNVHSLARNPVNDYVKGTDVLHIIAVADNSNNDLLGEILGSGLFW